MVILIVGIPLKQLIRTAVQQFEQSWQQTSSFTQYVSGAHGTIVLMQYAWVHQ